MKTNTVCDLTGLHKGCFVCGEDNSSGLKAEFAYIDGRVECDYLLKAGLESLPGVAHGGILVSLMDAAMAQWLLHNGVVAVTALMETKFRRSASPGDRITVTAEPDETRGGKGHGHRMVATIKDASGETVAETRAVFVDYDNDKQGD